MDFFQLAPLVAGLGNLLLSLFVVSRDFRSLTNRIFCYWGLCLSIWTLGAFALFHIENDALALDVARLLHFGVIFLPVLYTHLAVLVTGIPMKRVLPWAYAISVFLAFANFTDYFISGVRRSEVVYFAVSGPLYGVLSAMVTVLGSLGVWFMFKRRRLLGPLHRRRVSAMISALALLMILGAHDLLPVMGIHRYPVTGWVIYPLGTFAAFMFPVVVSYSVLQNQLLDIRFTLGRIAATLVRLLFFSSIGFGLLFLFAVLMPGRFTLYSFMASLIAMLISGCISSVFFPKLLGAGAEALERRILGDRFEYQEQLQAFSDTIHLYTDAARLLEEMEGLILKTMKVSSFHAAVLDPQTNQLVVQRESPAATVPIDINLCTPMMELFRKTSAEFLDFRLNQAFPRATPQERNALTLLGELKPELCLPLYSNQEPFGFILLGKKQSETAYTSRDLELLMALAKNLSLVLDQIRLKKRVELTEQLESLAVMSRGLAHDLNNLLTPINTFLQLVSIKAKEDPDEEQFLQIASKNMTTIRAYIREAVFFSTTLTPKIAPVSTRTLLDELAAVCRHNLDKNNISLAIDLPEPFDFYADLVLLQRLLSNLVFNAIDASPSGSSVTVRAIQLPCVPGRARWLRLLIIDQGSGISRENINRVFAPYFTTKNLGDKTRGFGLGLTICQKIVHLHRGTITLHSIEGQGTTVQIDLPAAPPEPPSATATHS
jgi:signal transduction histidine kinase